LRFQSAARDRFFGNWSFLPDSVILLKLLRRYSSGKSLLPALQPVNPLNLGGVFKHRARLLTFILRVNKP
jgi:hypothetical protein